MNRWFVSGITAAVFLTACAQRVPEPAGVAPGTPRISWVLMSGDRDNPDAEYVCQSDPRDECVVPASRPDNPVFSNLHIYYHGAGGETRYTGSIQVGYFDGPPESNRLRTNILVRKNKAITNQSVADVVTSTPGIYEVTFDLMAAATATGGSAPIRETLPVTVK